jgi:putative ABC transport system substrate-binding protein
MKRREFISLLGSAAVGWPLAARAQQPAMPVVGSLYGTSAAEWAPPMVGFRRGLSEMGFVEGRNVAIEYRWADSHFDRMPAMAADLVSRKVAVILVGGSIAGVRAALGATRTIPIVFTTASDPVASGLVESLNRPGGNATGVTVMAAELASKKVELLREIVPTGRTIALLVNPNNPTMIEAESPSVRSTVNRLGLEMIVLNARTESEIESSLVSAAHAGAAGVYIGSDAFLVGQREQIAALGMRYRVATMSPTRDGVVAGGLMSYGPDQADMYRQAGVYIGRILKGEKPADLPVLQPTKFELVINLNTARMLGLVIPQTLHAFASELIE